MTKDERTNENDYEFIDEYPESSQGNVEDPNKRFLGHYVTKITAQRGIIIPENVLKTLRAWDAEVILLWRESYRTVSLMTLQTGEELEEQYRKAVSDKINEVKESRRKSEIKKYFRILLSNRQTAGISVNGKITLSKDLIESLRAKTGEQLHLLGLGSRLLIMNNAIYDEHYGDAAQKQYFKYQQMFKDISLDLPDDFPVDEFD